MVSRATVEGEKGRVMEKIFFASIIRVDDSTLSFKKFLMMAMKDVDTRSSNSITGVYKVNTLTICKKNMYIYIQ